MISRRVVLLTLRFPQGADAGRLCPMDSTQSADGIKEGFSRLS